MNDPPGDPKEITRFGRGRIELGAGEEKGVLTNLKFMKLDLIFSETIGTEKGSSAKRKSHNGICLSVYKSMMVSEGGVFATRGGFF